MRRCCSAIRRPLCIAVAAVCWAVTAAAADPRLADLGGWLERLLMHGKVRGLTADLVREAALEDPRRGCRADYSAWIEDVRGYRRALEALHGYHDLPTVAAWCDDPVRAPMAVDDWIHAQAAGPAGIDTAWRQVARLAAECASCSPASPDTPAPSRPPASDEAAGSSPRLNQTAKALAAAAERIDRGVLGRVPQADRDLMRFVAAWLCRGGRFVYRSKGASPYPLATHFAPLDELRDGEPTTSLSGTPVPPALRSVARVNRYLHALAGMPVNQPGPLPAENGPHPEFTADIDFAALGDIVASLAAVLGAAPLAALEAELKTRPATGAVCPGATGTLLAVIHSDYGPVIVGGSGPNSYADVAALAIIDVGGEDDYLWRKPEDDIGRRPLSVIVDCSGDDVYRTDGVGGPAAGLLGLAAVIDRGGDDRYLQGLSPAFSPRRAARAALLEADPETNSTAIVPYLALYGDPAQPDAPGMPLDAGFAFGAGFLGIGLLVDEGGDDLYLGQKFALGTGFWRGIGLLHDTSGSDIYAAGVAAIGAGINGGIGLLDDREGRDHYQCLGIVESGYSVGRDWDNGYMGCGIGFGSSWRAERRSADAAARPTLGGGLGIVHDSGGDDAYVGSSFGIAAAYAGGVGVVVDEAGNDVYFVKRGPGGDSRSGWSGNHALGNGCHRGIGYLLDRAGDDVYSGSSLGGGTAWDMAAGYLLDLGGDDRFTDLYGRGVRGHTGWGASKAFAVSYHVGGADRYERGSFGDASSIGEGYPGKGGNFSFFLDRGPEPDEYPPGFANDVRRLGGLHCRADETPGGDPEGLGVFEDGSR